MWFVIGMFVGGAIGVFVVALLLSGKEADRSLKKQGDTWSEMLRR